MTKPKKLSPKSHNRSKDEKIYPKNVTIRKNCQITVIFQKKMCMDSTCFPPICTQHYGDYFNFWVVILWFDLSDNSTKQIILFILTHVIKTLFIDSHILILVSLQTALYWHGEMQSIDSPKSCIFSKMLFINSTKSWFFLLVVH